MKKKLIVFFVLAILLFLPVTSSLQVENKDSKKSVEDLPYYLDGTVLDGNLRVIITESGEPLPGLDPDLYDLTLSFEEENQIINVARQKYIITYGVDPLKTEEEDKGFLRKNILKDFLRDMASHIHRENYGKYDDVISVNSFIDGPHQEDGKIILLYVPAYDTETRPPNINQLFRQSKIGFRRFQRFGVETEVVKMLGIWDGSDVTSKTSGDYLHDLIEDCYMYKSEENQLMMGWAKTFSDIYAGRATRSGFAIGRAEAGMKANALTQHELSHCFGAPDHGWQFPFLIFPFCIMNYLWVSLGILPIWCDNCKNTINNHIWQ